MGKIFERIDDELRTGIAAQSMFFVATSPLAAEGHVNVSPKGPIGSFAVVDDHTVPLMSLDRHREHMNDWASKKDDAALAEYKKKKNLSSIDGLPALTDDE